jgi:TrmH family RNA methyltransferase
MFEPPPATVVVASRDNARIVAARRLHQRKHRERERRFLVEGPRAVGEAFASGAPVVEVFYLWGDPSDAVQGVVRAAADLGITATPVTRAVLEGLATTETPQGVVGVCRHLGAVLADVDGAAGPVPVLVEIQDPGNLGTVLRSADAAGAAGVVITAASVDLYNPKVVRASAGSLFHLPVVRELTLRDAVRGLRSLGLAIVAASADGDVSLHQAELSGPVAILFGNEARGLPEDAVRLVDSTIRIPIAGRAESLNLAAAATVVLFEAARQREMGSR